MGLEIERRFLVEAIPASVLQKPVYMRQGYLPVEGKRTARVRIAGDKAYFTAKGPAKNHARTELEWSIPLEDAQQMLDEFCDDRILEKVRYHYEYAGLTWEIDVFLGLNYGLIIAEVELSSIDQVVDLPPGWLMREIGDDESEFYNAVLVKSPFLYLGLDPSRVVTGTVAK